MQMRILKIAPNKSISRPSKKGDFCIFVDEDDLVIPSDLYNFVVTESGAVTHLDFLNLVKSRKILTSNFLKWTETELERAIDILQGHINGALMPQPTTRKKR